jgi:hypothetical protein
MKTEKAYKWLTKNRTGGYSSYEWPAQGIWTPRITEPMELCNIGYHLVTEDQLVGSYMQEELWEVEYDASEVLKAPDKICVREAVLVKQIETINSRTLRLFAADCAEQVLHIYEQQYPEDFRPRKAIEVARKVAYGVPYGDAERAAWSAAWNAVWSAARSAARSAAWSAAYSAAESAARSAAWSAAGSAALSAAYSAASSAEREWQLRRFKEYMEGKERGHP